MSKSKSGSWKERVEGVSDTKEGKEWASQSTNEGSGQDGQPFPFRLLST